MSQTPLSMLDVQTLASAGQCGSGDIEAIEEKLDDDDVDILRVIAARIRALGG